MHFNECFIYIPLRYPGAVGHLGGAAQNVFERLVPGAVPRQRQPGELYNADPASGDARQCGTTASLCGIEKAGFENDPEAMGRAVRLNLTLHAMMFMQTGIPMLYSGDEIAQVNDYSYRDDPEKAADSRYLHRGRMHWELAARADDPSTPEGRVFTGLRALGELRRVNPAFEAEADVWTLDAGDDGVLAIERYLEGQKLIGVFNFTSDRGGVHQSAHWGETHPAKPPNPRL